jgi:hypothetical protein
MANGAQGSTSTKDLQEGTEEATRETKKSMQSAGAVKDIIVETIKQEVADLGNGASDLGKRAGDIGSKAVEAGKQARDTASDTTPVRAASKNKPILGLVVLVVVAVVVWKAMARRRSS